MTRLDRFRGCLLGLAAGDAVGTTVEFMSRGTFEPLTDMVGGGPFHLKPGQWTDDTSMALCLADSLLECDGFDERDQMDRYVRWAGQGYLSSTGSCFDIGGTIQRALARFVETDEPFAGSPDPYSAGNGCIMRLAPIPMFYYSNPETLDERAVDSSRTTHATIECTDACRLLARIIRRALMGASKDEVALGDASTFTGAESIRAIARGDYLDKSESEIRGSGYVVESLEAAMWCFNTGRSFEDTVLKAANLGDDADTTAAVCGQIAGAFYGAPGIPAAWREQLALGDLIIEMATRMCQRHGNS